MTKLTDTQKASIEAFCDKEFNDEYTFYDYLFAKYLQNPTSEAVLNSILTDAMEKGY